MIGNASAAGRSVSPSSHVIVDCQNHFDRRSILTLKFKFYKHFWLLGNQKLKSAISKVYRESIVSNDYFPTGLLAVTDEFVDREACFRPKWPAMAMYTYDVYLNCWAVSFLLPFDNSSVASLQQLQLTPSRHEPLWNDLQLGPSKMRTFSCVILNISFKT